MKKECVAMLLAGGQGSRLYALTSQVAKPAVPFGSKYRIIDFPLSNCTNSGIDTVGVLTQYQPLELNAYLGNGQPWDLDRSYGGVHVLPPYVKKGDQGTWYKGTANAIYQNIEFIDKFNPEHVLILSGDHIYKMNYNSMLAYHVQKNADITIAMIPVDPAEASRFGILQTDDDGKIVTFEEKPKQPKSNTASMGIYIFKWSVLRKELILDEQDKTSANDFGKNIIPKMLKENAAMFGYRFEGYWKDVGTVESLWQANMDLLDSGDVKLDNHEWPILSKSALKSPHFLGGKAVVANSLITEGCYINGKVEHSVLADSVVVEEGATVVDSVILSGAKIEKGARVIKAIVGENATIGENSAVGIEGGANKYVSPYCSGGVSLVGPDVKLTDLAVAANSMVVEEEGGAK